MEILILYNLAKELKKGKPSDLDCEQEISIIVPIVDELLTAKGHRIQTLETTFNLWEELKHRKERTDLVLNLAEGFGGTNSNEPLVPAMLEALEIPFTGATSRNMQFTADKEKTKLVLASHGLPVPPHQLFRTTQDILSKNMEFPLIVKPVREEASIGIDLDNVVTSPKMLASKVQRIIGLYKQPALVEKFIEGREISVGLIGNLPNLHVYPTLEFLFEEATSPLARIRSYEYKWGGMFQPKVPANLPEELDIRLKEYSKTAFRETDCTDYARVDYRVDKDGNPFLLEVNNNPGIGPNTHGLSNTLTMTATFEGIGYEDFIETIVNTTAKRYGIS